MEGLDETENTARMLRGELYFAFTPSLTAARQRCVLACRRFNASGDDADRRKMVELWHGIIGNTDPLPPVAATPEEDEKLFENEPYVLGPITVDYGTNLRIGAGVFINFSATFLDTCTITIGARTLIGPNCSFYAATHPLDPYLRNGVNGPELGKPIVVGEDCWFGGNVTVCPGVTIGRGCTIGAGSVVTKDVPEYSVVAGNPARVIRKIEVNEETKKAAEEGRPWRPE